MLPLGEGLGMREKHRKYRCRELRGAEALLRPFGG